MLLLAIACTLCPVYVACIAYRELSDKGLLRKVL